MTETPEAASQRSDFSTLTSSRRPSPRGRTSQWLSLSAGWHQVGIRSLMLMCSLVFVPVCRSQGCQKAVAISHVGPLGGCGNLKCCSCLSKAEGARLGGALGRKNQAPLTLCLSLRLWVSVRVAKASFFPGGGLCEPPPSSPSWCNTLSDYYHVQVQPNESLDCAEIL